MLRSLARSLLRSLLRSLARSLARSPGGIPDVQLLLAKRQAGFQSCVSSWIVCGTVGFRFGVRMPFAIVASAAWLLPESRELSIEATDVSSFAKACKIAFGVSPDADIAVEYEDPDFDEWCEVDDLDEFDAMSSAVVQIRLIRRRGFVAAAVLGPNLHTDQASDSAAVDGQQVETRVRRTSQGNACGYPGRPGSYQLAVVASEPPVVEPGRRIAFESAADLGDLLPAAKVQLKTAARQTPQHAEAAEPAAPACPSNHFIDPAKLGSESGEVARLEIEADIPPPPPPPPSSNYARPAYSVGESSLDPDVLAVVELAAGTNMATDAFFTARLFEAPSAERLMERMARSHVEKGQMLVEAGASIDEMAAVGAAKYAHSAMRLYPSSAAASLLDVTEQYLGYWAMLSRLKQLRTTKFDAMNPRHTALLADLWKNLMPDHDHGQTATKELATREGLLDSDSEGDGDDFEEEYEDKGCNPLKAVENSSIEAAHDWSPLGFQTPERPSNDLRAMGILGLQATVHFASRHTELCRGFVQQSAARQAGALPFAITAINVAQWCRNLVESADFLPFLLRCGTMGEQLFYELHATVLQRFSQCWQTSKLAKKDGIMAFGTVSEHFVSVLKAELRSNPIPQNLSGATQHQPSRQHLPTASSSSGGAGEGRAAKGALQLLRGPLGRRRSLMRSSLMRSSQPNAGPTQGPVGSETTGPWGRGRPQGPGDLLVGGTDNGSGQAKHGPSQWGQGSDWAKRRAPRVPFRKRGKPNGHVQAIWASILSDDSPFGAERMINSPLHRSQGTAQGTSSLSAPATSIASTACSPAPTPTHNLDATDANDSGMTSSELVLPRRRTRRASASEVVDGSVTLGSISASLEESSLIEAAFSHHRPGKDAASSPAPRPLGPASGRGAGNRRGATLFSNEI